MTEYFTGHKDSAVINEYLNAVGEGSKDFKVVYGIRKIGESFVAGTLSLEDVRTFTREIFGDNLAFDPYIDIELRGINTETIAFIHQMKSYTFYTAICHIGQGMLLSPFEMKLKDEIEHPSWKGEANTFIQKCSRWWYTRWKHPLVFNEPPHAKVITFIWSVVRMQKIVKD